MTANDDSALVDTEVHYLASRHVGDEFKISIGHCRAEADDRPPVLFVSDAILAFGTAVEMVRLLNLGGDLPPLLVVGIGYRVATIVETLPLRQRDFTPTVTAGDAQVKDPGMMGGADRFADFLHDELKPWVVERFGVDAEHSVFFGDSYGGLFATHLLLTKPTIFQGYAIGSPSYWWDDCAIFDTEAEYAKRHDDLQGKVFLSVGGYENPEGARHYQRQLPPEKRVEAEAEEERNPTSDMVAATTEMATRLEQRRYPGLELQCQVFPGEYHHTVPPLNLSRALRYLFDAPS